ncbi:MAG: phytanoyl-CoA dioxygenase family protein [Burkholderiales bacterium]|jgi:ectoine hydroxylase-related dioxygenase (phytanoyl-CoA dioxygenase family)
MRATMEAFEQNGYAIVPRLIQVREAAVAARALERVHLRSAGTRNLLRLPWCRALVQRINTRLTNSNTLSSSFVAVQCTLFDKNPERNWLVALHQDLSIPVKARVAHASLGAWSKKEDEHFVRAPAEILEKLFAVRIHIDDCGSDNGPLRVVPGSHLHGRIGDSGARDLRNALGEAQCLAASGDAVLIRPLILHASSKATTPSRRRVLHILCGPPSLPYGLAWKYAV